MDVITHLIAGIIFGLIINANNINIWIIILIASILPDLFTETSYRISIKQLEKKIGKRLTPKIVRKRKELWTEINKSKFLIPYHFMHSIFFIIIIGLLTPYYFFIPYFLHILIDAFTHSKKNFGIILFWPFYTKRFGINKNWWEWKFFKKIFR